MSSLIFGTSLSGESELSGLSLGVLESDSDFSGCVVIMRKMLFVEPGFQL